MPAREAPVSGAPALAAAVKVLRHVRVLIHRMPGMLPGPSLQTAPHSEVGAAACGAPTLRPRRRARMHALAEIHPMRGPL